jgi:predicted nucleic acid-binding protein
MPSTRTQVYFTEEQRRRLDDLPIDAAIGELAGLTRRRTGIATPDALIAATALLHRIPLLTRNRRHFDRIDGLRVLTPA